MLNANSEIFLLVPIFIFLIFKLKVLFLRVINKEKIPYLFLI
jgi:hypothetical protein